MDIVESNLGKLETQLQEWGTKLTGLVEKAGTTATADYRKGIDELKSKHLEAQMKFNQLKSGGSDHPMALLRRAGVDLSTPETVLAVVTRFETLVTKLERAIEAL